jgi:hypothetical protein
MRYLAVLLLLVASGSTMVLAQDAAERDAITAAALNYIEGWFEGNSDRMDKALHPELAKRGIQPFQPTGGHLLTFASKSNMVEYTKAGFGKLPPEERKIEVEILDVHGPMAAVKVLSAKFVDYLQLAKIDGSWSIVNVLWVPATP